MAIPTHGPFCQTVVYPTACWGCGAGIHVLQCTCGSVALFDDPRPPWPPHECPSSGGGGGGSSGGGIGGSGLSGWAAIDQLTASGVAITSDIMARVFPGGARRPRRIEEVPIQRIEPSSGDALDILALVRETAMVTRRTAGLEGLSEIGRAMLGLPKTGKLRQVTLLVNGSRPNLSYTCVWTQAGKVAGIAKDQMVYARIEPNVAGDLAIWLVREIHVL